MKLLINEVIDEFELDDTETLPLSYRAGGNV